MKGSGTPVVTAIFRIIRRAYSDYPWIPFRQPLQSFVRKRRAQQSEFEARFKGIRSTVSLACDPSAATQMHILTCHKHVAMFLTSTKSLLRFKPKLAVVVHDDGSLTPADVQTIEHHIRGIRIVSRKEADDMADQVTAGHPRMRAYRAEVINSLELTDHLMFARGEKLIITNSDTLFLSRPDAILEWIAAPAREVLCVYESQPYQQEEYLAKVGSNFPAHVTLGLVCFPRLVLNPQEVEGLLAQADSAFDPWYLGQNIVPALLGKTTHGNVVRFLDANAYQASGVFSEGAIYRHYWSSLSLLNSYFFADGARVISELKEL